MIKYRKELLDLWWWLIAIYMSLLPTNSDQLRTSDGTPSARGSFWLMAWAKRRAVCCCYQYCYPMRRWRKINIPLAP